MTPDKQAPDAEVLALGLLRKLMEKIRSESGSEDPMAPFAYDASWEALAIEIDDLLKQPASADGDHSAGALSEPLTDTAGDVPDGYWDRLHRRMHLPQSAVDAAWDALPTAQKKNNPDVAAEHERRDAVIEKCGLACDAVADKWREVKTEVGTQRTWAADECSDAVRALKSPGCVR